jgi:hypothetical protein
VGIIPPLKKKYPIHLGYFTLEQLISEAKKNEYKPSKKKKTTYKP